MAEQKPSIPAVPLRNQIVDKSGNMSRAWVDYFQHPPQGTFIADGSGATLRTIQSRLRDEISVKDFGAVGDGAADDWAAFQSAVTATPEGASLYIPAGTYILSRPIVITAPGVRLRGASKGGSILQFTGPGDGVVMSGVSAGDWTLDNFTVTTSFSGSGATGTATVSGGVITGATITAGGTYPAGTYHVPVTFVGGGGSFLNTGNVADATGYATITGGVATGIVVTNPGAGGYTTAPYVLIGGRGLCVMNGEATKNRIERVMVTTLNSTAYWGVAFYLNGFESSCVNNVQAIDWSNAGTGIGVGLLICGFSAGSTFGGGSMLDACAVSNLWVDGFLLTDFMVDGGTIQGATKTSRGGIASIQVTNGARLALTGAVHLEIAGDGTCPLILADSAQMILDKALVVYVGSSGSSDCIWGRNGSILNISGCYLITNVASGHFAIRQDGNAGGNSNGSFIRGNTIASETTGARGIHVGHSSSISITDNVIDCFGDAIELTKTFAAVTGNNIICESSAYGCQTDSPVVFDGNVVGGSAVGVCRGPYTSASGNKFAAVVTANASRAFTVEGDGVTDTASVILRKYKAPLWSVASVGDPPGGNYAVGTVSCTAGSFTVTGTGTTFTSAMAGGTLRLTGTGELYAILAYVDATHITLEIPFSGTTASGLAFTIYYLDGSNIGASLWLTPIDDAGAALPAVRIDRATQSMTVPGNLTAAAMFPSSPLSTANGGTGFGYGSFSALVAAIVATMAAGDIVGILGYTPARAGAATGLPSTGVAHTHTQS